MAPRRFQDKGQTPQLGVRDHRPKLFRIRLLLATGSQTDPIRSDPIQSTPIRFDSVRFDSTRCIYTSYFLNIKQDAWPMGGKEREHGTFLGLPELYK